MKMKTYEDWKLLGFQVKKGQKASGEDKAGNPVFTKDQTKPLPGFDQGLEDKE
jgi:hypothetical protein